MILAKFERQVFSAAMASPACGIPLLRHLTATSINLRVDVTMGGFIDAFHNEQTDTTAFALIQQDRRVFGADNTGGRHVHPFENPDRHEFISGPLSFAQFIAEIERKFL